MRKYMMTCNPEGVVTEVAVAWLTEPLTLGDSVKVTTGWNEEEGKYELCIQVLKYTRKWFSINPFVDRAGFVVQKLSIVLSTQHLWNNGADLESILEVGLMGRLLESESVEEPIVPITTTDLIQTMRHGRESFVVPEDVTCVVEYVDLKGNAAMSYIVAVDETTYDVFIETMDTKVCFRVASKHSPLELIFMVIGRVLGLGPWSFSSLAGKLLLENDRLLYISALGDITTPTTERIKAIPQLLDETGKLYIDIGTIEHRPLEKETIDKKESDMTKILEGSKYIVELGFENTIVSMTNLDSHAVVDLEKLKDIVDIVVDVKDRRVSVIVNPLGFIRSRAVPETCPPGEIISSIRAMLGGVESALWRSLGLGAMLNIEAETIVDILFLVDAVDSLWTGLPVCHKTGRDFVSSVLRETNKDTPAIFAISPMRGKGMVIEVSESIDGVRVKTTIDGELNPNIIAKPLPNGVTITSIVEGMENLIKARDDLEAISRHGQEQLKVLYLAERCDVNELREQIVDYVESSTATAEEPFENDLEEEVLDTRGSGSWLDFTFPNFSIRGPIATNLEIADVYDVTTSEGLRQVWFEPGSSQKLRAALSMASEALMDRQNMFVLSGVCSVWGKGALPVLVLDTESRLIAFQDYYSKKLRRLEDEGSNIRASITHGNDDVCVVVAAGAYRTSDTFKSSRPDVLKAICSFICSESTRIRHNPDIIGSVARRRPIWEETHNAFRPQPSEAEPRFRLDRRRTPTSFQNYEPKEEPVGGIHRDSFPYQIVEDSKLKDHSTDRVFEVTMGELGFGFYVTDSLNVKGSVFYIPVDSVVQHFKPRKLF